MKNRGVLGGIYWGILFLLWRRFSFIPGRIYCSPLSFGLSFSRIGLSRAAPFIAAGDFVNWHNQLLFYFNIFGIYDYCVRIFAHYVDLFIFDPFCFPEEPPESFILDSLGY